MTESIIILVIFFGLVIWALISNSIANGKSGAEREKVRFNLQFIRTGMSIEEVVGILGPGKKIDYLEGQKIKLQYEKNERRNELIKDMFMDSNPYYHIRVRKGYLCLYYGGETYTYTTNGYKGTDTRTYWGISLYFNNGILEYTE